MHHQAAGEPHNFITAYLQNQQGLAQDAAELQDSAWQVTRWTGGGIQQGSTWRLRIIGDSIPVGPETVYYSILVG